MFVCCARFDLDAAAGCVTPPGIKYASQLTKPEHRKAPDGFHSVTSLDMPGREIVVFPGSPGTPAYPAYNPYRDVGPHFHKLLPAKRPPGSLPKYVERLGL